jgi:hypothetical protein
MKKFTLLMLLTGCGSSGSMPDASVTVPDAPAADLAGDVAPVADASADLAAPADADEGPRRMTVSWSLTEVDSNAAVSCAAADTPTVVLSATPSVDGGNLPSSRFTLPCAPMQATTDPMPPGRYHVEMILQDGQGMVMSTVETDINLQPQASTDLGVIIFPVQRFALQWSLQKGGQTLTCAQAGAETIELINTTGPPHPTYSFPCAAGSGNSPAIAAGTYLVQVRLRGVGGAVLAHTTATTVEVVSDRRAVLPPVTFVLP